MELAGQGPNHLVLLVNGLFGCPEHWNTYTSALKSLLPASNTLIHASTVNCRFQTYQGISTCGKRLAEEMKLIIKQHPSLKQLSVIGHSMGALMLRYALGLLYNPGTKRIYGLNPVHFVAVASPHLGLSVAPKSIPEFPVTACLGSLFGIGPGLRALFKLLAAPVAKTVFRSTGSEMLWLDGDKQGVPLIVQLVEDWPQDGLYYYSALSAFQTRTTYANVCGDQWVAWPNGSLRQPGQLPLIPSGVVRKGRGVIYEEDQDTFDNRTAHVGASDLPVTLELYKSTKEHNVGYVLRRLQQLTWKRVDVSFKGSWWGTAHNNIQARSVLHQVGKTVAQHVAKVVECVPTSSAS